MQRIPRLPVALLLCLGLLAAPAAALNEDALGFERTPPRLSLADGQVSFLRAGASEWTPARVNTPLAPGDELYADDDASLELQIGPRAYVRGDERTQLGLAGLEPDYLQLRVATGSVSLDLRSLAASTTIEVATPNAAFTIERTGYYRIDVQGDETSVTTRRGGRAVVTPATGPSAIVEPSEQLVLSGVDAPTLASYAAPELDAWDRWNYARTDDLLDAVSARYVSPDVYGVADLDHYGDWRLMPAYGAVWVPRGVAVGWVPYSTGDWIYDPFYGWTWVDTAPWGWAPYHYGRWVLVGGYWGWAPGPMVVRPYYAPALVAFFGGGGVSIGFTIGAPTVGWVALGWGEPLLPWWGPVGFRGHPHWARWGGPHVVNRVVVKRTVVVDAREIHRYEHAHERGAIVTERRDRFGRRTREPQRFTRGDPAKLAPVRGELPMKPDRSSLAPATGRAPRPPYEIAERPVVATRRAQLAPIPELGTGGARAEEPARRAPPMRIVEPTRKGRRIVAPERPPFARQGTRVREMPPPAPRFDEVRRQQRTTERAVERDADRERDRMEAPPPSTAPRTRGKAPETPSAAARARGKAPEAPSAAPREQAQETHPAPAAKPGRREAAPPSGRALPGEPANSVWRGRSQATPRVNPPQAQPRPQNPQPPPSQQPREERSRGGGRGGSER